MKLWYAKVDYQLRLGRLVTVWTVHISNAESGSLTPQDASLVTSIFPERDNSCYFMVQENDEIDLFKTPLGYRDGKQLDNLMTLRNYIDGGHEIAGVKILVCVKSIGGRKKCKSQPHVCCIPSLNSRLDSHNQERRPNRKSRPECIRRHRRRDPHPLGLHSGISRSLESIPHGLTHYKPQFQKGETTNALAQSGHAT